MGLDGLCQSIARIVRHFLRWTSLVWKDGDKPIESFWVLVIYNVLFWLLILVANIPLFVLAYKKISKKFGFLSIIFLVVACITGFCIGLIPTSEQWFMISKIDSANLTWETGKFKDFSIFLYAILWAFLQGVFASALLIIGCCTGGADILGVYWSHKKFKDIGASFILVHLLFLFACNLIGSYIPFAVEDPIVASFSEHPGNRYELENFFNPSFVAGFIMVVVNGIVLNVLFPKFKMVKVEIISNQVEMIQQKLNILKDRRYATSTLTVIGGYSHKEQKILLTTCLYIDAAKLLETVRGIDQNALFTVMDLKKADGYIYTTHEHQNHLFKHKKRDEINDQQKQN